MQSPSTSDSIIRSSSSSSSNINSSSRSKSRSSSSSSSSTKDTLLNKITDGTASEYISDSSNKYNNKLDQLSRSKIEIEFPESSNTQMENDLTSKSKTDTDILESSNAHLDHDLMMRPKHEIEISESSNARMDCDRIMKSKAELEISESSNTQTEYDLIGRSRNELEISESSNANMEYEMMNKSRTEIEISGNPNQSTSSDYEGSQMMDDVHFSESTTTANYDQKYRAMPPAIGAYTSQSTSPVFDEITSGREGMPRAVLAESPILSSTQQLDDEEEFVDAQYDDEPTTSMQMITTEQQRDLSADLSTTPPSLMDDKQQSYDYWRGEGKKTDMTRDDQEETIGNGEEQDLKATPQQQKRDSKSSDAEGESDDFKDAKDCNEFDLTRLGTDDDTAKMVKRTIEDFCRSREIQIMRRLFTGISSEVGSTPRDTNRYEDRAAGDAHAVTGEYVKEGFVIGKSDCLSPLVSKEYLLPLKDNILQIFLSEPGLFRAICCRTQCLIEVTKRILNRKLCIGGRWNKFVIIRISGPSARHIHSCDRLMKNRIPQFKVRTEYQRPAFCRMFFREDIPDNTRLYENYQRTGSSANRFGYLKLDSPYGSKPQRPNSQCPWKVGRDRSGSISFSGRNAHKCMSHVYNSYGFESTQNIPKGDMGMLALKSAKNLQDRIANERIAKDNYKRELTIPICR